MKSMTIDGFKDRRRIIQVGNSPKAITIPYDFKTSEKDVPIVGRRLILIDPEAKISEDDLYSLLTDVIEPHLEEWLKIIHEKKEQSILGKVEM